MAYSARNWGFTPHNTSIHTILNNMILSYSHQISDIQSSTKDGQYTPDALAKVLKLSKAHANKLFQEDNLKDFIMKFLSGQTITASEVIDFLSAIILNNPYIDDNAPKPTAVEFVDFADNRLGDCSNEGIIRLSKKTVENLVNSTASIEERFRMLYRMIITCGHENTHFVQYKLSDNYQYSDALDYIGFVSDASVKGWTFLKKFADTKDIDAKVLQNLSNYIYANSPHEIDARYGGIIFANHLFRELAARLNKEKDIRNFEENYSAYVALEKLREELRLDHIINETSTQYAWDREDSNKNWLAEILSRIDIEKLAKLGINLQNLILNSKNKNIEDYNIYTKQIGQTFYSYNSLLQFICMANEDDGNFSINLLRQFIKDGNLSSTILLRNMIDIQHRNTLDINLSINLVALLTGDEVNISTFQHGECLRTNSPLIGNAQRINIFLSLIEQDKFQYLMYILPDDSVLASDKYIQEALHKKVMEYTYRINAQDLTFYPEHFYLLGNLVHKAQMFEDENYMTQFLPILETMTNNMHPQQIRLNHAKIYGKEASDFYYDKYMCDYALSQNETKKLCDEITELVGD